MTICCDECGMFGTLFLWGGDKKKTIYKKNHAWRDFLFCVYLVELSR